MQEARDAIKRQGPVIEDRYGQPKAHPALKIEVDAPIEMVPHDRSGAVGAAVVHDDEREAVRQTGRSRNSASMTRARRLVKGGNHHVDGLFSGCTHPCTGSNLDS